MCCKITPGSYKGHGFRIVMNDGKTYRIPFIPKALRDLHMH